MHNPPQVIDRPLAKPSTGSGGKVLVRHIVKLDSEGQPADQCLCGHVWDKVFLPHGSDICQACVDIQKSLGGK